MTLTKLENLIKLDPPTKAGIRLHLITTWVMVAAIRLIWHRLIWAMSVANSGVFASHLSGLWLIGCCLQLLTSIICFTSYKFSIRYWIPFLYGYWVCSGIAMLGIFFEHMFAGGV